MFVKVNSTFPKRFLIANNNRIYANNNLNTYAQRLLFNPAGIWHYN